MNIADTVSFLKDIATILALLLGAFAAIFIYFQLAPTVELTISPTWADERKEYLLVRFQIENKSKVRLNKPRGKIQILEYPRLENGNLSQYVPFSQATIPESEIPITWREPSAILTHTKQIYPGEIISYERLYHYPQPAIIIHIGLQLEMRLGLLGKIATQKREAWQQTTTCFVVKSN
jgi:hypothetical protein